MKTITKKMNKLLKRLREITFEDILRLFVKLLPHIAIVISGMLIVFFVIDRVNKPMGFLTNEFHKTLLFVLSLLSIWMAVQVISLQRRRERAEYARRVKKAQEQRQAAQRSAEKAAQRPPVRRTAAPSRPVR